ncbi:monocarboxylate transporter 14-like [Gigantopelta aegis]|uniref:monocarboxylate transporter 14-like n=1 Tax=Gigantopelta aegis TaxID=1735272 RepID=UPI001B8895F3|nr:monocarboxylate transporter 14-like [Gigantopelta aegis]XP_041373531.1 monocarboxylate transporter 14-like [Gigantopelta aegis]
MGGQKATKIHKESPEDVIVPAPSADEVDNFIPEPPDGGWGWVIVASSLVCNIIVDGIGYTFGILLLEFVDYFQASKSKVSLIGSLQVGMYLCVGPIVSALTNRFGCRPVCITGSLVATTGFILSTFSPNVDILILTYGVMGGIGFGMMYLPAIVSVGFYFEKKRAIATGIGVCGSGIGMFIFAPLTRYLLDAYDWKSTILILAGIVFNGIVCGALMRPLEAKRKKKPKSGENGLGKHDTKFLFDNSGTEYTRSVPNIVLSSVNQDKPGPKIEIVKLSPSSSKRYLKPELITVLDGNDADAPGPHIRLLDMEDMIHHSNQSAQSQANRTFISEANLNKLKTELSRPMYRKDIFYSGSIMHIPEFRVQPNMKNYIRSVTSIQSEQEMCDIPCFKCLPRSSRDTLADMLNLHLFKNVTFLLICLGNILAMLGFYVPFVYLADRAIRLGIAENKAAFLLSVIGITNTIGRVLAGFLADLRKVDSLVINNIAMVILGVGTMLAPLCDTYALFCVFAAVFGLCVAAYISLTSIILCDLLGLENLTNAFGLLTLARGISSAAGPPIAGAVFEISQNYNISFYMGGAFIIGGALCHIVLHTPCMTRRTKKATQDAAVVTKVGIEADSPDVAQDRV